MACLFKHNWSWPRRRGGKDVQFCPDCGAEREARVHFDGPRYRRTQDGIPNFIPAPLASEVQGTLDESDDFTSVAA